MHALEKVNIKISETDTNKVDGYQKLCYHTNRNLYEGGETVSDVKTQVLKRVENYLESADEEKRKELLYWLEGFAYHAQSTADQPKKDAS